MTATQNWQEKIAVIDEDIKNSDRRHKYWRDGLDITAADRQTDEGERYNPAKVLKLSKCEDWIDIIYSRNPEDLHHLAADEAVSRAINALTTKQKQAVFLNIVHGYTPQDIGKMTGTTARNVRKLRDKALDSIRLAIGILQDKCGENDIWAVGETLIWILLPIYAILKSHYINYKERKNGY